MEQPKILTEALMCASHGKSEAGKSATVGWSLRLRRKKRTNAAATRRDPEQQQQPALRFVALKKRINKREQHVDAAATRCDPKHQQKPPLRFVTWKTRMSKRERHGVVVQNQQDHVEGFQFSPCSFCNRVVYKVMQACRQTQRMNTVLCTA